jgi:hypothetical protein
MGIINVYYLNGVDLASSTSVYTDALLTTLAPDGFYGGDGIVREQVGGVLQPATSCASCGYDCGFGSFFLSPVSYLDNEKIAIPVGVGSLIGCSTVTIQMAAPVPFFGVRIIYGSNVYNYVVGAVTGYMQAQVTKPTWLDDGSCVSLPVVNPVIFNEYQSGSSPIPVATGNSIADTILTGDIFSYTSGEILYMFIPKTSVTIDQYTIEIYTYQPCISNFWVVDAGCVQSLPSEPIHTATTFASSGAACGYTGTNYQQIYVGRVTGVPGTIAINDILFMDSTSYTRFAFPAGWYLHKVGSVRTAIEVDSNGVVINTFICP